MEEAIQKAVEYLLAQGIPGVVILGLGWAVFKLYNRNQELHQTLYDIGRESVKANEATTAAINRLTDLLMRNTARRG